MQPIKMTGWIGLDWVSIGQSMDWLHTPTWLAMSVLLNRRLENVD